MNLFKKYIHKPNGRVQHQHRQDLHHDKNLKEILDELYDEYHENEYKKWCEVNEDFLMKVKLELRNSASQGLCYYEIVLVSKNSTHDKWHFENWLEENNLRYDYELYDQKVVYDDVNQYLFKIRWK